MLEEWWVEDELKGTWVRGRERMRSHFPSVTNHSSADLYSLPHPKQRPHPKIIQQNVCPLPLTPTSSSSPLTFLPSSAAARAERRINHSINLLNFALPDLVPPFSHFSSLFQSLSFCFRFPESIPDAFRTNALPLLSKPESHSRPPSTP